MGLSGEQASRKDRLPAFLARVVLLGALICFSASADLGFKRATGPSGAGHAHDYLLDIPFDAAIPMPLIMAGGVAAGDYDNDGDVDLYLVTGNRYPNVLLNNDGAGQFTDQAELAGVALSEHQGNGPVFADMDGDGWLDLFVGGMLGGGMRLFRNQGDGSFAEVTEASGVVSEDEEQNDFSASFGDPDGDGDLDIYIGHWGVMTQVTHLWMNAGDGSYQPADAYAGIADTYSEADWSFSPGFSDVNGDGRSDLMVTSDYQTSHMFRNRGGLKFENVTTEVIDDRAGMGSAIGDFDNDGDLDWFVTAIWWNEDRPGEGNRLYDNDGKGNFSNITEDAGVLEGDWGWGACTQDFDNDGWLDLFHVNGMVWDSNVIDYENDPSRLFMNKGDGHFVENAIELGIEDYGMGKGVVCFDADLDGDIDIFTANTFGMSQFYRNTLTDNPGWLQVKLAGEVNNPSAVGAVIRITTSGLTQMREIRVGSNYLSQDPLQQHFGLGGAEKVDELRVSWPHGGETVLKDVDSNQRLVLSANDASPPPFVLVPGMSGAWYDTSHSGEGFVLEMLADGRVVLYWFTYDSNGNQDWYFAIGNKQGRRVLFPELLRLSGGEFGDGFDPDKVTRTPVGTAAFTWTGCNRGFMDWSIGTDMGRQQLARLTRLVGLDCSPGDVPKGEPRDKQAASPGQGLSGAWYDPTHSGEGFVLQILEDGRAVVFWFSYDPDGNRRWFYGSGNLKNGKWVFDEMLTSSGGIFGDGFDQETVKLAPWGRLELALTCASGTATWVSTEAGFDAGSQQLIRLTKLDALVCN